MGPSEASSLLPIAKLPAGIDTISGSSTAREGTAWSVACVVVGVSTAEGRVDSVEVARAARAGAGPWSAMGMACCVTAYQRAPAVVARKAALNIVIKAT